MADIHGRGRLPIVVGGTGLWLRCLLFGLVEAPGRNEALREALEAEARQSGWPALHAQLAEVDPVTAARVHPTDPVRIVRALEVFRQGGVPLSTLQSRQASQAPRHRFHALRLDPDMAWLTPRIEARVTAMFADGLVQETRARMEEPRSLERLSRVMGYREVLALLDGRISQVEARELIVRAQRQYAKRQRTWFRAETHWQDLPSADPYAAAVELLRRNVAS